MKLYTVSFERHPKPRFTNIQETNDKENQEQKQAPA